MLKSEKSSSSSWWNDFSFCGSGSGSGSGVACFRTALRRRTFGFSAGADDLGGPEERGDVETERGTELDVVDTAVPPPKVEVGGTNGSLS